MLEALTIDTPITDFNFAYTQESVVRFIDKRNAVFFSLYDTPKEVLITLINKCINLANEPFAVSYSTYTNTPTLYISKHGLQLKPFWYGDKLSNKDIQDGGNTRYISVAIEARFADMISEISKSLCISKGDLAMLLFIAEYSPKHFIQAKTHTIKGVIARFDPNHVERIPNQEFKKPSGLSFESISEQLENLANDLNDQKKQDVDLFINNIKRASKSKIAKLKKSGEYDNLHYIAEALSVDGEVLSKNTLPVDFVVDRCEQLYAQNLKVFQGAYCLRIHDPFLNESYLFYPALQPLVGKEFIQGCNFTLSLVFFNWIQSVTGVSLRFRISMFNQAFENLLPEWIVEHSTIKTTQLKTLSGQLKTLKHNMKRANNEQAS